MKLSKILTIIVIVILLRAVGAAQSGVKRGPVILELFTSEGCSSCPPADELLRTIDSAGQIDGIPVVVLGEHVDYWDHEGWRDTFSSQQATLRQTTYKTRLHFPSEFTPQVVVDGRYSVLGSDAQALRSAVHRVAADSSGVTLTLRLESPDSVTLSVQNNSLGRIDVQLALIESDLSTNIRAGENRNVHLRHAAVVRRLVSVTSSKESAFQSSIRLPMKSEWDRSHMRIVAFAQVHSSEEIVGSAIAPVL